MTENIKLVINVIKNKNNSFVNDFLRKEDNIKKLLDKKNINFRVYDVTEKNLNDIEVLLIEVFNMSYILKLTTRMNMVAVQKELYFLKRFQLKTFEEFINEKNKVFDNNYSKLMRKKIKVELETYEKNSGYSSEIRLKTKENCELVMLDVFEAANNLYLFDSEVISKFNKTKRVWVECFENEDAANRLLDISLTLNVFVSYFNKTLTQYFKFSLNLPRTFKLKSKNYFFIAQQLNMDLRQSSFSYPNDLTDAFSHFSYYLSKGELVIIDLRTFKYQNGDCLLLEPVIFSTFANRFSSSDLGLMGIEKFKMEHSCNDICKKIGLDRF
jgi:energy-coupling factor transporter ATP-binding protein EcfA2